jgi:purine-binding chemotaxis protein CheW
MNHAQESEQLLTFQLDGGLYGIGILDVREIRGVSPVTSLPGSPAYVKGIVNLRGSIVPVIDLRIRLGLEPAIAVNRFAVIIVTQLQGKSIGLLADGVTEVVTIANTDLRKPPLMTGHGDQRFIRGLVLQTALEKADPTLLYVLDLERLHDPSFEHLPSAEVLTESIA